MRISWEMRDNTLILYVAGELDHHAAHEVLAGVGRALDEHSPLRCTMDLSGLTFMDSSGIAVVLGTYRRLKAYGGQLTLAQVPGQAAKVLGMAGVDRIVPTAAGAGYKG